MKVKTFDCVEMQHRGAAAIREKTRGMTPQEELAFWKERTKALRKRQQRSKR
jgi:hypothetical protein